MGEEVAEYDGAYKVTEGLWKRFGDKRLVDNADQRSRVSSAWGVGASIARFCGPVMELMFWSFASVAWGPDH